ncbi:MAG TPA: RNA polymerase sigma factor [Polyangiaceae bacterium]
MSATELYRAQSSALAESTEASDQGGARELDLETLYRNHALELSRFIARLSGRDDDAADVLHEVFLVVQRRLATFRPDASVRTWIYAIAARVVIARRRKLRLRRLLWLESGESEAASEEPVDSKTPEHELEGQEAARRVRVVLERLSERDRTLLVLFELEGFSARDVAQVVASSENAVWVGLSRARARFKKIFCELFGGEFGNEGEQRG